MSDIPNKGEDEIILESRQIAMSSIYCFEVVYFIHSQTKDRTLTENILNTATATTMSPIRTLRYVQWYLRK